jgi:Zn finger protein HypA/HybF involved in hydrogenase expression
VPIETTCRDCRREYEPDRAAILAGNWRTCPQCRDRALERQDEDDERRGEEAIGGARHAA